MEPGIPRPSRELRVGEPDAVGGRLEVGKPHFPRFGHDFEKSRVQRRLAASEVDLLGAGTTEELEDALLAGEVDFIFEALGSASGHIRAGKLRAIAVTSAKRSPSFPEIPTAIESGLPGFEVTSWYGLWVPAGTPRPIVQRLHALVAKAFEEQDMRELWFKLGAEPGGASPEQFAAFVRTEVLKWGKVVRDAKVTIE